MTHALPIAAPIRVVPKPEASADELVEFDARAELLQGLWVVPAFLLLFLLFAILMPGGPANG